MRFLLFNIACDSSPIWGGSFVPPLLRGYGGNHSPHYQPSNFFFFIPACFLLTSFLNRFVLRTLSKACIVLLSLCCFFASADCCCCCCDDTDPGEEENPGDGSIPGGSCVSMTPAQCQTIKDDLLRDINAQADTIDYFRNYTLSTVNFFANTFFSESHSRLDEFGIHLGRIDALTSEIQGEIANAYYALDATKQAIEDYRQFWLNNIGAGRNVVSNVPSGYVYDLSRANSPPVKLQDILRNNNFFIAVEDCLSKISLTNSSVSVEVSSIRGLIDSFSNYLIGAQSAFYQIASDIQSTIDTIDGQKNSLLTSASSLNCSACTGGDPSGGNGVVIDLQPLIDAVESFHDDMNAQFESLIYTITGLFNAFSEAQGVKLAKSDLTYGTYHSSGNWFTRIELLLLSLSGLANGPDEPISTRPDDASEIDQLSDGVDTGISGMNSALTSAQGTFTDVFNAAVLLLRKFSFLGSSVKPSRFYFVPDYAVGDHTYSVSYDSPNWLSVALDWVRYLFQAFYLIVFCSGLWFFFVYLFRYAKDIFLFLVKLYSAIFGGSG